MDTPIPCAGAVVRDDRGRLLLVRRGQEPGLGQWSIPGGRVEPGESAAEAVAREVEEETGLRVVVDALAGVVERPALGGGTYLIEDHYARVEPGRDPHTIVAGSDAAEVGWFSVREVAHLDCVDGLVKALTRWGVLPPAR